MMLVAITHAENLMDYRVQGSMYEVSFIADISPKVTDNDVRKSTKLPPFPPTPQPHQIKRWQHKHKQKRELGAGSPRNIGCSMFISEAILRPTK